MQALSTRRGTSTPMWLGLWVMLKYRTKNNYCNGLYLFGRLFDKTVFTFLTATFYLWVGKNNTAANVPNLGGLLFLWCACVCAQCLYSNSLLGALIHGIAILMNGLVATAVLGGLGLH
jgi:hypothetical protein